MYLTLQYIKLKKPTNPEPIGKGQRFERIRYSRDNQLEKFMSKTNVESDKALRFLSTHCPFGA